MTRSFTQTETRLSSLALAVTDLRAHFEAQLRTVARAEEAVARCRNAADPAAFTLAATTLRGEVTILSENNGSVRAVIDQLRGDAAELAFPAQKPRK